MKNQMEAAGIEPATRSFRRERSNPVERRFRETAQHGTPRVGLAEFRGSPPMRWVLLKEAGLLRE